jgi:virulence factor Mce-like protein
MPTLRTVTLLVPAAVLVAIIIAVTAGGPERYRVDVHLANAQGLHEGTAVLVGGAKVGEVKSLGLGPRDVAVARLDLDPAKVEVGSDATIAIRAQNLLGERTLTLDPGTPPSGPARPVTIPASRTEETVALDQVFDTLDGDTRTRLAILLNEAGIAFTGRSVDMQRALRRLPQTFSQGTELLRGVESDNHSLGEMVGRTDRLLARLTPERKQLGDTVAKAAQVMDVVAERRQNLERSIHAAPATLRSLRATLDDLKATARPLLPAAKAISATSGPLSRTLDEIEPFRTAAGPTLDQAKDIAPALSRLGIQATPVLRAAAPTIGDLATLATSAKPLTETLDQGAFDDALSLMEGWARAIQQRDGISHVFRGRALISSDTMRSIISALPETKSSSERPQPKAGPVPPPGTPGRDSSPAGPATPTDAAPGAKPEQVVPKIVEKVSPLVDKVKPAISSVTGTLNSLLGDPAGSGQQPTSTAQKSLLDFLLK